MANITDKSQILNVQKVENATIHLDDAAKYLLAAKESILNGKEKCNTLLLNGESIVVGKIDKLVLEIENEKELIEKYSVDIKNDAKTFSSNETQEYNDYLEEKSKAEENEKATKNSKSTDVLYG